jgi:hypothetical protein
VTSFNIKPHVVETKGQIPIEIELDLEDVVTASKIDKFLRGEMDSADVTAFQKDSFEFGKLPEISPTSNFCFKEPKKLSNYNNFVVDVRDIVKYENPQAQMEEIAKIVGTMWEGIEEDTKERYKNE